MHNINQQAERKVQTYIRVGYNQFVKSEVVKEDWWSVGSDFFAVLQHDVGDTWPTR